MCLTLFLHLPNDQFAILLYSYEYLVASPTLLQKRTAYQLGLTVLTFAVHSRAGGLPPAYGQVLGSPAWSR